MRAFSLVGQKRRAVRVSFDWRGLFARAGVSSASAKLAGETSETGAACKPRLVDVVLIDYSTNPLSLPAACLFFALFAARAASGSLSGWIAIPFVLLRCHDEADLRRRDQCDKSPPATAAMREQLSQAAAGKAEQTKHRWLERALGRPPASAA